MYWLITYQWKTNDLRPVVDNYLYKGSISEWMLMALEQPESWKFLNAQELTEEDYGELIGKIG